MARPARQRASQPRHTPTRDHGIPGRPRFGGHLLARGCARRPGDAEVTAFLEDHSAELMNLGHLLTRNEADAADPVQEPSSGSGRAGVGRRSRISVRTSARQWCTATSQSPRSQPRSAAVRAGPRVTCSKRVADSLRRPPRGRPLMTTDDDLNRRVRDRRRAHTWATTRPDASELTQLVARRARRRAIAPAAVAASMAVVVGAVVVVGLQNGDTGPMP